MSGRKKLAEDTDRLQVLIPKPMKNYLERQVQAQGYGATISSVIRAMIHKEMKETGENAEDSTR